MKRTILMALCLITTSAYAAPSSAPMMNANNMAMMSVIIASNNARIQQEQYQRQQSINSVKNNIKISKSIYDLNGKVIKGENHYHTIINVEMDNGEDKLRVNTMTEQNQIHTLEIDFDDTRPKKYNDLDILQKQVLQLIQDLNK